MPNAFVQVDLSDKSRDFQRIALEPGVPLLDRAHSTGRLLRVWLGRFIAEPEFVDAAVVQYYVNDEHNRRISAADVKPIRDTDVGGLLQQEVESVRAKLAQVKPRGRTEERVLNVIRERFEQLVSDPQQGSSEGALFRYRDAQGKWRLVWCWGYRRSQSLLAKPVVCHGANCRRLYLVRKTAPPNCPQCQTPVPVYRFPWKRVAAATCLLFAALGAGGWWCWQTLPRSAISGQIVWHDFDAPVAEAEVSIPALKRTVRSDAAGRFRLDRLPAGQWELQVAAEGFQPWQSQRELARAQEAHCAVELMGSDDFTGRIVDADSRQPVAAAEVHLEGTSQTLLTDDAGQFHRAGFRRGALKLLISKNGYPSVVRDVMLPAVPSPIELELAGDAILIGRVVTAAADKPVADVAVTLDAVGQTARTDADGWFAFRRARSGRQNVLIEANGYAVQNIEKELASGQERQLQVKLSGAAKLSGTVARDIDSAPLLNAEARVPGTKFVAKMDDRGRFELRGLMPQRTIIEVAAPGYATERLDRTLSESEETVLAVKLQGDGQLVGRVMDAVLQQPVAKAGVQLLGTPHQTTTDVDGKFRLAKIPSLPAKVEARASGYGSVVAEVRPLPNTEVAADLALTGNATVVGAIVERWSQEPVPKAQIQIANTGVMLVSSETGQFEIKGLRGGAQHELQIAADGLAPKREPIEVRNGQTQQVRIVLSGVAQQAGQVVSAVNESPVPDAKVQIAGSEHHALTDNKGQFQLDQLRAGPVKFEVSAQGFKSRLIEQMVASDSKPLSILLGGDAIVAGQAFDSATHKPVADTAIRIANTVLAAKTDVKGRFRIEGAFAGPAKLLADAAGYPPVERTVELKGARETELKLELAGTAVVTGEVVDDVNQPVAGAAVQLTDTDYQVISGTAGEFQMPNLRAGNLQVALSAEKHARKTIEVALKTGETKPLGRILLPRSLTLRGQVLHALQKGPVANAAITVASQKTVTDGNGRFQFGDLQPGRIVLLVEASNFVTERVTVDVETANERETFYLCPALQADEAAIVLTWRGPAELDAHLYRAQDNRATAHVFSGKLHDGNLTGVYPTEEQRVVALQIRPLDPGRYEFVVQRIAKGDRGMPADAMALQLSKSEAEVKVYRRGSNAPLVYRIGRNKRATVWQPFALEIIDARRIVDHVYKAEHYQLTLPPEIEPK